jgi:hypothetical protein
MTPNEFAIAISALSYVYQPLITIWLIFFVVLSILASIVIFFYMAFRRGFSIATAPS